MRETQSCNQTSSRNITLPTPAPLGRPMANTSTRVPEKNQLQRHLKISVWNFPQLVSNTYSRPMTVLGKKTLESVAGFDEELVKTLAREET